MTTFNNDEELADWWAEHGEPWFAVRDATTDLYLISQTEDGDAFYIGMPQALTDAPDSPVDQNQGWLSAFPGSWPLQLLEAVPTADPFRVDARHLERQRAFSRQTFGPGARLAGVLDHIRKELEEVEAAPQDMSEWADLVILAFDGALRQGHDPQALLDAIEAKQTKNESRTWPDWRTQPGDKAIEHVR